MDGRTTCRACGAAIRFFKTPNGKSTPVNAEPVAFIPDPAGKDLFLIPKANGIQADTAKGWTISEWRESSAAKTGYISHFATCPEAEYFRKHRKGGRRGG